MPPAVLRVALPLPRPGLFDYLPPPDASAGDGWIGCRVRVRFGPRRLVGVVAEVGAPAIEASRLRPLEARLDAAPLLRGEHWSSLRWIADYYHAPLGEVLALCLPTPLREGQPLPEADRRLWQACADAQPRLREDGRPARLWAALAAGPQDAAALQGGLQQAKAQVRANRTKGGLRREDLSCNDVGPEFHTLFAEILRRSGMVRAASNALCQNLDYWGFTMELSVPQSHWWRGRYGDLRCESNRTAYYHGDEGSDLIKVIIYLSDVIDQNGPFSFLPGSWRVAPPHLQFAVSRVIDALYMPMEYSDIGSHPHTLASREGRRHFAALPPELRHVSHWGNDVIAGSELERAVAEDEERMTGNTGSFILFDGARLFHRGGLVGSGERWACQVILRPV